jgi:membrane protease YdiL (CAAX protease family)
MTAAPSNRLVAVMGLMIALGLPFCHLGDLGKAHSGLGPLLGGEILWWALFVLILIYVLAVERRPLSSIGFRAPGGVDILLAVVFAVGAILGIGLLFSVILPALHLTVAQKIANLFQAPFWFRVLIVARAAFVEETTFRGYGFERLSELSGSKWLAALATCGLFTLAHYSGGGWGQVIIAAWGGVVLTALYLWRRNLWANILCHWLTDGVGFLLLPMLPHH